MLNCTGPMFQAGSNQSDDLQWKSPGQLRCNGDLGLIMVKPVFLLDYEISGQ